MRRIFCFILLTVFFSGLSSLSYSQYYFYNDSYYDNDVLVEVGGSIGAMNCLTDLGGKRGIGKRFIKDLNMGNTNPAGGVFINVMIKNSIGIRLEGTYGKVSAHDSVLKGVTDIAIERYYRNQNFRSNISEVSLMTEIHPWILFTNWEMSDRLPPRISPYLIGGLGYFSFNPQGQLGNNWIDLQPLSTEGQGFKEYPDRKVYKLKQFNIPMGFGGKFELSPLVNLRAEFIYRKLNTDYLDDCSTTYIDPTVFYNYFTGAQLYNALTLSDRQIRTPKLGEGAPRGKPTQKDAYFSFNIKASIIFGRGRIR